jgi:sulfate/thiosulfate transport system ATP-binding protein
MGISVQDVSKRFGDFQALDRVSVDIKSGSLVALLGPSGSGKSTLLRSIAGLEMPDAGKIFLTGEDATARSVQERQIGFVFQHYALFKHMTVRENIGFGMKIRKMGASRIKQRVEELLELVQLGGLGDGYTFPGSNGSGCRWRGRWRWSRRCYFWMSRLGRWMRRCVRI